MIEPREAWEPRAELLKAARASGVKLSESQLGRLHRVGLVPSPRTRPLGRGKGTVSEFPPGSTAQLLRVLEVQKATRTQKFSTVAWHLWWEDGGSLLAPARELLIALAARWDRARDELSGLLDREDEADSDAVEQMEAFYKDAEGGRAEGPLGTARRNAGREGFASVARVIAEIATGRFESYQDHEEPAEDGTPKPGTRGALVERALRIDRARNDRIGGSEPRFKGSSEDDFAHLSRIFGRRSLSSCAEADDSVLDQARVEVRGLLTLLSTFAPLIERVVGRDAGGFGTIGRVLSLRTPRPQAFMLLAWLVLREDEGLLEGMRGLVALVPKALAAAELERLSNQLAEEVPALAPPLSSAVRAQAKGDAAEAARSRAEIARVSDEHREQVDDFFRRHPEVDELVATVDDEPLQST
jgi:hypothetical protein